mgnify:CR=1 FL=1
MNQTESLEKKDKQVEEMIRDLPIFQGIFRVQKSKVKGWVS